MQANPHKDHFKYVEKIRQGNDKILEDIYQKYSNTIATKMLRKGCKESDIADLFQDTMIVFVQKVNDKDFILTCPVEAYLLRVCYITWLNKLKKDKLDFPEEMPDVIEKDNTIDLQVENAIESKKFNELLDRTFSHLSDLCKKLLILLREGEKPVKIAELLDMSGRNAVYKRKKDCIDSWKKLVRKG